MKMSMRKFHTLAQNTKIQIVNDGNVIGFGIIGKKLYTGKYENSLESTVKIVELTEVPLPCFQQYLESGKYIQLHPSCIGDVIK